MSADVVVVERRIKASPHTVYSFFATVAADGRLDLIQPHET